MKGRRPVSRAQCLQKPIFRMNTSTRIILLLRPFCWLALLALVQDVSARIEYVIGPPPPLGQCVSPGWANSIQILTTKGKAMKLWSSFLLSIGIALSAVTALAGSHSTSANVAVVPSYSGYGSAGVINPADYPTVAMTQVDPAIASLSALWKCQTAMR
jgi:hypothetical protein